MHRGRLLDHVQLVVKDLAASRRFYLAVFDVLGIPLSGEDVAGGFFWADELCVSSIESSAASGRPTGPTHLALQAKDRTVVDRFHAVAIAAGGKDNGPPGIRSYLRGYYAAFVFDPDGNNIEAVHYGGAASRSAESVKITF